MRWDEMRWDVMRWDETRWDELREREKRRDETRRDEIKWNVIWWDEMSWDEMRWDVMRWDEMSWDEMRWDEMSWDEMRWTLATINLNCSKSMCPDVNQSETIWLRLTRTWCSQPVAIHSKTVSWLISYKSQQWINRSCRCIEVRVGYQTTGCGVVSSCRVMMRVFYKKTVPPQSFVEEK